jgi:hypothetical protein
MGRREDDEVDSVVEQPLSGRRCVGRRALVLDVGAELVGESLDLIEEWTALRCDEEGSHLDRRVAYPDAKDGHDDERRQHQGEKQPWLADDVGRFLSQKRCDLERPSHAARSHEGCSLRVSYSSMM